MAANKTLLPALACWALIGSPAFAQQPPPGSDFPPGPGRDTVVAVCGTCHDINRVKAGYDAAGHDINRVRAGYDAAGWNMLQHMMQNMGAPVPPQDWPAVTTYLTKNFPEKPRPPAANLTGPVQVTIKMWDVPTIGSPPRHPPGEKERT